MVIYQMITRLFGNCKSLNKHYGTLKENGVGKFDDISDKALAEIRALGISHIWYTGVIEHAVLTDYSKYGIVRDFPEIVKGMAGSPYAIRDYYDVNPDLARDVPNRMQEFESLIDRTHKNRLKAIIDFVPNHVARIYSSDNKPEGVIDFGTGDDQEIRFSPHNNFYYIPDYAFKVPQDFEPIELIDYPIQSGTYQEFPARATGNDQFTPTPTKDDWFETVKLNYGVNYEDGSRHFDPFPDTWFKMLEILSFWTQKGVDGFRCDMAQMVPVEFWTWVIPKIKELNPDLIFIAEIYEAHRYHDYIFNGKFDYLYDKVGLYDTLRDIIEGKGSTDQISNVWKSQEGISSYMLRFLENHDEQRIASKFFAQNPDKAIPGMVISAMMHTGPVMIYFGQEVGEPAQGPNGFSGDDGRTTYFDYWGVPEHQKWMNDGAFDGGNLSDAQRKLRASYTYILRFCTKNEAINIGQFYDLHFYNRSAEFTGYSNKVFAFLRYTKNQRLLIVANFNERNENCLIKIPNDALKLMNLSSIGTIQLVNIPKLKLTIPEDLIINRNFEDGLRITVEHYGYLILKIN